MAVGEVDPVVDQPARMFGDVDSPASIILLIRIGELLRIGAEPLEEGEQLASLAFGEAVEPTTASKSISNR